MVSATQVTVYIRAELMANEIFGGGLASRHGCFEIKRSVIDQIFFVWNSKSVLQPHGVGIPTYHSTRKDLVEHISFDLL
jgi:hypothetical protein